MTGISLIHETYLQQWTSVKTDEIWKTVKLIYKMTDSIEKVKSKN